jgi:hypothetical protein
LQVFWPIQWCVQVEVCDVDGAKLCVCRGHHTVEEYFCCFEFGCPGALVTRIIDEIAPDSHVRAVPLLFLGSFGANEMWVCGLPIMWHFMMQDEGDGVGALDMSSNALGQSSELVGC